MRGVQGCWAILVLVEVLAASASNAPGPRDEVQFVIAMMTKLKEAGEILRALPARTQVIFMCDDDDVRAVSFCDSSHSVSHSLRSLPLAQPDCILHGAAGGGQSVHQARRGILAANASAWRTGIA